MNKDFKKNMTADEFKNELYQELTGGILERIGNLRREMRRYFWGKEYEEIIDNIIIAAMAGQPILLIGKPGFAKSLLMTTFFSLIGLNKSISDSPEKSISSSQNRFFHYLLHSFTMPDEILGVVKIGEFLEENKFVRQREGALTDPMVKAAFLDEIFNANSTILNTLLSIINEREFYEGGIAHQSNLFIVAGAANRVPVEPELMAFFDRFPMRLLVEMDLNNIVTSDEYLEKTRGIDISSESEDDDFEEVPEDDPVFMRIIEQGIDNMKNNSHRAHGIISDRLIKGANMMPSIEDFQKVYEFIVTHYSPADQDSITENGKETLKNLVEYLPLSGTCSLNGRKMVKLYLLAAASAVLRSTFNEDIDEAFETPAIDVPDLAVFRNIWKDDNEETISEHRTAVNNFINEYENG